MLSLIICSKSKPDLQAVTRQVEQTVGVPYEIIAIDNGDGQYGICQAYNLGAAQSRYDYLCFLHEDLVFHASGWGGQVIEALRDPAVGLLGLMGCTAKTRAPSGWSPATDLAVTRLNFTQRLADGSSRVSLINPEGGALADVVLLDGCWLCCRREVWQRLRFDEDTFRHFHLYDLDFSLRVWRAGLRVCVLYGVRIEHLSVGTFGTDWIREALVFGRKWRGHLPVALPAVRIRDLARTEYRTHLQFVKILLKNRFDKAVTLRHLLACSVYGPPDRELWYLWSQFLTGKAIDPVASLSGKFKRLFSPRRA